MHMTTKSTERVPFCDPPGAGPLCTFHSSQPSLQSPGNEAILKQWSDHQCNPHKDLKVPKHHNTGRLWGQTPLRKFEDSQPPEVGTRVSWVVLKPKKKCEPKNTSTWTHRNKLHNPMSRLPCFPSCLLYDFKTLAVTVSDLWQWPVTSHPTHKATSFVSHGA